MESGRITRLGQVVRRLYRVEEALMQVLREGLSGSLGSIVDVPANRTLLEIRGAKAPDLLAHGIAIDLDLRSFGPGRCARPCSQERRSSSSAQTIQSFAPTRELRLPATLPTGYSMPRWTPTSVRRRAQVESRPDVDASRRGLGSS